MQPVTIDVSFNIRTLKKTYTAPVDFGIILKTSMGVEPFPGKYWLWKYKDASKNIMH